LNLAFAQGFATSAALIVAIGAQNAFVLRQGLKREHVLAIVLVCALSDALLITVGVLGLGSLVQRSPMLLNIARFGGAGFLILYGALAMRRAFGAESMTTQGEVRTSARSAILTCLALTYFNPHCWLDTVVLLGSIASQQKADSRGLFGLGAASASFAWFFALGYGAAALSGLFARPMAWKLLDGAVALTMWMIALSLLTT
jgi:L-lysine exporter family protein LysE/ArgO